MFDYIKCQYPLPMPEDPKGYTAIQDFQTKDLKCFMGYYEIRQDGKLWREERETEWVSGNPKAKSLMDRLGYMSTKKVWFEEDFYHGSIEIYDCINSNSTDFDYWIEYEIQFDRGTVINVRLLNFEATPNQKRKERDKAFQYRLAKHEQFVKTKRYKYIILPYIRCVRKLFTYLQRILDKTKSLLLDIENKIS